MNLERELKRYVRQVRPGLIGSSTNPNANLRQLIEEIKVATYLRAEIVPRLQDFLLTRDYVTALTESGLTLETGVFSEVLKRLEHKILPKPVENSNFQTFLANLFDSGVDQEWLEEIDRSHFVELMSLIMPEREVLVEALSPQFFISLEILSLRLAGLGYDPVVADRLRLHREYQMSFMEVPRAVHSLLDGKGDAASVRLREAMKSCHSAVEWIRAQRSTEGVSLGLTNRLIMIQEVLRRMEMLLDLIEAVLGQWKQKPALDLFFEIALSEIRRFNLRSFVGKNLELLAYEVTEHTGKVGEHYITRTRSEWLEMFKSAAIGGAIVGVLVILKEIVFKVQFPAVPEAILAGALYSVGFLLILWAGGTLATKQPAMTAARLAGAIDSGESSHKSLVNLAEIVICTIRSQLIALFGNFIVALPVAALLSLPFAQSKFAIMNNEHALKTLGSLNPFTSLSLLYAAFAGVGLFLSGLVAGVVDNWFIFNKVGSRLRHSDILKRFVKPENLDSTISSIDRNLGIWAGTIALGFYLGSMKTLGVILGLPLEIRHITFSSGQFGLALATLKGQTPLLLFFIVLVGVFLIGLVNLAVSFSLSLYVAIKSRRIRFSQTPELLGILHQRFQQSPMDFIIPAKGKK